MTRRSRRREAIAAAERALERSEQQQHELRRAYDDALTRSGVVLIQQVAAGRDAYHLSASVAEVLGWDPSVFLGTGVLRGMVHPDDLERFEQAVTTALTPAGTAAAPRVIDLTDSLPDRKPSRTAGPVVEAAGAPVLRFRSGGGGWATVQLRADAASAELGVLRASLVDVTREQRQLVRVRRFAEIVERDPSAHLVVEFTDPADPGSLVIRAANTSAHDLLHLEDHVADGTPLDAVLGEASAKLLRSALFDVRHTGEAMTAERLSLVEVPGTFLDLRIDLLADATLSLVLHDVTSTAALEERLRHQASHDALTGLPNRALFEERLVGALETVDPATPVALILVDVEGFRALNEHLGLHLADRLLVDLGRRLVREVRGCALVSRLGADQFAVLTMPCSSHAEATERARAVSAVLESPFDLAGEVVHVSCAVGVTVSTPEGCDAATMLRSGLTALERAKGLPERFAVAASDTPRDSIHRLGLLSELRQGLANQELELRFQPVIDLRTARVVKVESTLHWRDGAQTTGVPVEFLELAEQSGLIQPLTRWMLAEAASAAARLRSTGHDVVVSCDLSIRNLFDPAVLDHVVLLISTGELDPASIELEISETELMDDPIRSQDVLRRLDELSVRTVVDDFGTGYTSLATVRSLPVSGLKIDRSFVATVGSEPADAAIVRSTIELSHELGLSVGADGVADEQTLATLASFGCDLAQGSHLSEAVGLDELAERIDQLELAARGWIGTSATART